MLKNHHKRAVRQSIFSGIVVFFIGAVMFVSLRPAVFSQAANIKKEPVDTLFQKPVFKLPTLENSAENKKEALVEKTTSKIGYATKPQGLPIYTVTKVVDGNTIDLDIKTRVRLIGIKAPEIDEEMGLESYNYLKKTLEGKDVYLQIDTKNPKDFLDRTRGIIYLDKKNINIEMLRLGFAHIYTTTPSIVEYSDWLVFEREAREAKRGLWGGEKSANPKKEEELAIPEP